jgi:hypothetical protein
MAAHINAAVARWLELVTDFREHGGPPFDPCDSWLAFRCGISTREAREYVRVAEALHELPAIRDAFRRGELTFTKVRALTRIAIAVSEQGLLELAKVLTASQLDRALRAYRQVTAAEARETHELEYLDYYWDDDGSLVLRARLAAEDGTIVVRALDACRERVWARRREQQAERAGSHASEVWSGAEEFEPPRPANVEALVELAQRALAAADGEREPERAQLVVHVDAAALGTDGSWRCELEGGPVIAPETARRLGCDAQAVTTIERDGLPLSVGRKRRTVPPTLRRQLEARDDGSCRWPGCARRRHLQAHHRRHWAQGGETSLENLVLLCWHHHRLVHEGGYTIEEGEDGELGLRNRHGVLCPRAPRLPLGSAEILIAQNRQAGLTITERTNRNGVGEPMDLAYAVDALLAVAQPP